jgi:transcriptional regulator with XRE-family HTH domain
LVKELREMTGLSAASLGSALGVTREQYQRWVRGSAISHVRHGQLIYLHTLAMEVMRRLGQEKSKVWWRTPQSAGVSPEGLLHRRLADKVHRIIVALPDHERSAGGRPVGLLVQDVDLDQRYDESIEGTVESWSPYNESNAP